MLEFIKFYEYFQSLFFFLKRFLWQCLKTSPGIKGVFIRNVNLNGYVYSIVLINIWHGQGGLEQVFQLVGDSSSTYTAENIWCHEQFLWVGQGFSNW